MNSPNLQNLDETDLNLLRAIADNPGIRTAGLMRAANLTKTPTLERLKNLEAQNLIERRGRPGQPYHYVLKEGTTAEQILVEIRRRADGHQDLAAREALFAVSQATREMIRLLITLEKKLSGILGR